MLKLLDVPFKFGFLSQIDKISVCEINTKIPNLKNVEAFQWKYGYFF